MAVDVSFFDAAKSAREAARQFLEADPVLNNLILTLLTARTVNPEPGRYWVAFHNREAVGMGFQSPLERPIILASMKPDAASALGDAIATGNFDVPGVIGEAMTASNFADAWTKGRGSTAQAAGRQIIYEVRNVLDGPVVPGVLECAAAEHQELVHTWVDSFFDEIGELSVTSAEYVARRIAAGEFWLWNHKEIRSIAAATAPEHGVSRIQSVYTPREHRRNGYAEGLVRRLSGKMRQSGHRVMLYADSSNPTANRIYARVGYQALTEVIRYRFVARNPVS